MRKSKRMQVITMLMALGPPTLAATGCGDAPPTCYKSFTPEPKLSEIQSHVFDRSCAFANCHGGTNIQPTGGPLNLAAGKAHASLITPAVAKPSTNRVVPRSPSQSFLLEKLTSAEPTGNGARMPKDGNPLCPEEIDAIRSWITLGAMNN